MRAESDHRKLSEPLPADLVSSVVWGPFSYRRYPVFSWAWWWRRMVVFSILTLLYAALGVFGMRLGGAGWDKALVGWGHFIVGILMMFGAGPALAAWARSRHWPVGREKIGIVLAMILGVIIAMLSDAWASGEIRESVKPREVTPEQRNISELDEALLSLAKVMMTFCYFVFGGGMATIAYFSEQRRASARAQLLQRLESDLRLSVLQAQLEPHFLFNTLAAIRPLIRLDQDRAEAAFDSLAAHLRAVIPSTRSSSEGPVSTLAQQVAVCSGYMELMKIRMTDRLDFEVDVPDELKALPFPPLMLVSLVENAVKHGLEPNPMGGKVKVTARLAGSDLEVSVADDGAGLQGGLSGGLGLANIREQLAVRYGDRARLEVASQPGGGTVAKIVVPT